jgi:hypothetical protein
MAAAAAKREARNPLRGRSCEVVWRRGTSVGVKSVR